MGHGTEHEYNFVYEKMQNLLTEAGYANYFVGTVEAEPSVDDVLAKVQAGDYERVVLRPLMIVAGGDFSLAFDELGLIHSKKRRDARDLRVRDTHDPILDAAARPAHPALEIIHFHILNAST